MLEYFSIPYPNVPIYDYTDLDYTMPESIFQVIFHKRPYVSAMCILPIGTRLSAAKKKARQAWELPGFWRSGWDLNPRAIESHDGFRVFVKTVKNRLLQAD